MALCNPLYECSYFSLALSSFKVHAYSRVVICPGYYRHGIRGLGSFLEILFPNFRKGVHLTWVPLFLFLRCFCCERQIHKRTIPKSASWFALILYRSILARLFCRPFKIRGRLFWKGNRFDSFFKNISFLIFVNSSIRVL